MIARHAGDEQRDGGPLAMAVIWYRRGLLALAAAFLIQVVLGWFFIEFAFLSLAVAVAAPFLAMRGMILHRTEVQRLASEAENIETRRSARALRMNSGPIVLISIISGLIILAGLLNIHAMMTIMQSFESILGRDETGTSAAMAQNLSLLQVAVTLSLILWVGIVAGLVFVFLRVRKFKEAVNRFSGATA